MADEHADDDPVAARDAPSTGQGGVDGVDGGDGETDADSGNGATGGERDAPDRVRRAIREVRREALKAAAVHAVVDAVAVLLLVNAVLTVLDPSWLPARVPLPAAVADPIAARTGLAAADAGLPGSVTLSAIGGLVVGCAELWARTRQPLVEQFEAVNPSVAESLRTARDAVAAGADSRMARRLYEDVLGDLRETSSLGLVAWRRLAVTLVVVLAVSVATVQVAVLEVGLLGAADPVEDTNERAQNYTGLKDGSEVLGAPESVETGNETLTARVESRGGGQEVDRVENFPGDPGDGTGDGGGDVSGQQAGFAAPEEVEDADLVREYNRRIRDADSEDDT